MRVTFPCDTLTLEGELNLQPAATHAAVICHPHPQYGGDMDNNVVLAVTRALQAVGFATLRFNFRGVGGSTGTYAEGTGECDDARAAVHYLAARCALPRLTLAGYSFGAMVALQVGADRPDVDRLIAVAPPLGFFDLRALSPCTTPKLFIVGGRDPYCAPAAFQPVFATLAEPKTAVLVPEADHFFWGCDTDIRQAIVDWLG